MKERCWIVASLLALSLPPTASALDSAVFQCPGPSNTVLYTNIEQSNCRPMMLGTLTIAPTRTYSPSVDRPNSIPSDTYDYTSPIGSMRNRLGQGYPPQDLSADPALPSLGFGHGPGYPYPRSTGRLGQSPQRFGHGSGHPPQNFGNGLDQHLPGFGGETKHQLQGFSGASGHHLQGFAPGEGPAPQRSGSGHGHGTGRLR